MPRSISGTIYPLFTRMLEHHSNAWSAWTRLFEYAPRPRPVLDPELGTPFPPRCVVAAQPVRVPGIHRRFGLAYWRMMTEYYEEHRGPLKGRLPTTGRARNCKKKEIPYETRI